MYSSVIKRILNIILIMILSISVNIGIDKWREYKYKPQFEKYLSEKYSEEMVVLDVYKGSKWGEYQCKTGIKKKPKAYFYTNLRKDKTTGKYVFSDDYIQLSWQGEVQDEVEEYTKRLFDNVFSVVFMLQGIDGDGTERIQYKAYIPKSKIPTYSEVKNTAELKQYYKSLDIDINGKWDSKNSEKEYMKIFNIIKFIKEKEYNIDSISIVFGYGKKNGDYFTSNSDSDTQFHLSDVEINSINSVEDLKKLK